MNNQVLLQTTQHWTNILIGLWAVVSGLEWLSIRNMLLSKGLLDWSVVGLRQGIVSTKALQQFFSSPSRFGYFQLIRVMSGVLLMFLSESVLSSFLLVAILASCFYTNLRCNFGADGSDQMGMIVASGGVLLSIGNYLSDQSLAASGLLLIAGQLTLSYFIAGVAKVISAKWRNGDAICGVMRTEAYGHPIPRVIIQRTRRMALAVCWVVMFFEIFFPIIFILPLSAAIVFLCVVFLFHVGNAVFMGLNTFALSFPAAFPATLAVHGLLQVWGVFAY